MSGVGFPLWPFALVMAVGFVLLVLSFLWAIVRECVGYAPPKQEDEALREPGTEGGEP